MLTQPQSNESSKTTESTETSKSIELVIKPPPTHPPPCDPVCVPMNIEIKPDIKLCIDKPTITIKNNAICTCCTTPKK